MFTFGLTFYVPGGWEYAPFKPGDFVAIAGRRTFVPGVSYVALAYRRLGVGGPGHGIGMLLPLVFVIAGLIGSYFAYLGALTEPRGRIVMLPMLALGILGVYRLIAIHSAARQLNTIEVPTTTRSSGPSAG